MIDKKSSIGKMKDFSTEFYQSNLGLLLRGIISASTPLGPAMEVVSGLIQNMDNKRVDQLFISLDKRLSNVEESLLTDVYLDADWNTLLEHAIIKARSCVRVGQIEYISNVIIDVLNGRIPKLDAENLINVISELNGDEAFFFGHIGKKYYGKEMDCYGEDLLGELGEHYREKLAFLCSRLEARGLIKEKTGAILSYNGGTYVLTYVGQLLLQSIRSRENSDKNLLGDHHK